MIHRYRRLRAGAGAVAGGVAAAVAAGVGMYGLAKEAEAKSIEWREQGETSEGPSKARVVSELTKAGISGYGKLSV